MARFLMTGAAICNQPVNVPSKAIPGDLHGIDLMALRVGQISSSHEFVDDVPREAPIGQFNYVAHYTLNHQLMCRRTPNPSAEIT
jgi:hypothetical protein